MVGLYNFSELCDMNDHKRKDGKVTVLHGEYFPLRQLRLIGVVDSSIHPTPLLSIYIDMYR